jgi:hypothetical protein
MIEVADLKSSLRNRDAETTGASDIVELPSQKTSSRWLALALVFMVMMLFAGIRWRVRDMPLERDEGEYAYAGQLILQGIPPYVLAYNMKLPGTYVAYAAILRIFGETPAGIHIGLLLVNGCATLLVFFLGRRLYGDLVGAVAAASYALLSTSEGVLGLAGHATHFVVLVALAGLLFLLRAQQVKNLKIYFAAGLCMGLAFVMKQQGAVFILFGAQETLWSGWKEAEERKKLAARLCAYGAGAAIPYLLTCAALYRAGVFGRFWFWTVSYASQYSTSTGLVQGFKYLMEAVPQLFFGAPVVWCFAVIAIVALVKERGKNAAHKFVISLLFWSFLGTSAGLYYRDHYFVLMLPAICLLAGKAMEWLGEQFALRVRLKKMIVIPGALFVVGYGASLYTQREEFFELSPKNVIRQEYGGNPFPEAIEFGKYIREHSEPNAQVAVLGSEPEIYFYADRHSATGYIYTYGLMEEQRYASRMQQEMIAEIEKAKPEYLVKVMVPASWLRKTNSDTTILYWAEKYIGEEYQAVGVADIGMTTTYRWGKEAEGYRSPARYSVYLYKKKT